ncbi:MAG: NAD-dependent epimerase/dehydratase family protein, partial [Deltaproteobacteria bacterium]
MRALVTGGGGFLGLKLVDLLRVAGHEVVVLCRRIYPALEAQGVPIVQADVADAGAVTAACSGCDVVFHLAAEVSPWGPARDFERTNVLGTRVVFAACLSAGVSRLVYTSTPSVAVD